MPLARTGDGVAPLYAGGLLIPTPAKTSAYTANPSDFVPVDTTGGAVTITLPAAPADQTMVGIKMIKQGSSNAVTIDCGGDDTINTPGGSTSGTLAVLKQGVIFQYDASLQVWYVLEDSLPAGTLPATTFSGIVTANAGTDSAGSAPVISAPGFAQGVASQLSDLTRDYEVYLQFGASGTALTVAIGPTSTPANTLINSAAVAAGEVVRFRLPAGWYAEISFTTTTLAHQIAIGC